MSSWVRWFSPLLGWAAGTARHVRRVVTSERVHRFLTIALVLLGLGLRVRGYLFGASAFWQDECTWAVMLVEQPLYTLLIRPIGFMALSKAFALLFGASELVLRFLPWVAGVLATLITPALARRLFVSPAARLLFVAIIALHPVAIDFSKEFKPYSVSLFAHLGVLLLTLRYVERLDGRALAAALVALVTGILFTQDLVFAYPGIFLVLGWTAWRERPKHRLAIALSALCILGALVLQYVFIWSQLPAEEASYWGDKYDVFYTRGKVSYAAWWLENQSGMAGFPGYRRRFWGARAGQGTELQTIDTVIWIVLHVAGLLAIAIERRARDALLLVLPLAVAWVFNARGLWPAGVFRTNLFMVTYVAAIACVALDARRRARASAWTPIPALLLVVLPLCLFDRSWNARKTSMTNESAFPDTLRRLLAIQAPREAPHRLLLDRRCRSCFAYYTGVQPTISREIGAPFRNDFRARGLHDNTNLAQAFLETSKEATRVWIVMPNPEPLKRLMMRRGPLENFEISREERVGQHFILALKERHSPRRGRSTRQGR